MPGLSWHESLRLLKEHYPNTPIVILSAVTEPENVLQAIDIGASGFIPKTSSSKIILSALHLILSGGLYLPSELLNLSAKAEAAAEQRPADPPSAGRSAPDGAKQAQQNHCPRTGFVRRNGQTARHGDIKGSGRHQPHGRGDRRQKTGFN